MSDKDILTVAKGDAPADLLFINANVINTIAGHIEKNNVAIYGHRIAGIGDYSDAEEVIDINGKYICPGFIDGHIHLESTMLNPAEYANAVVPRGVLGVVTDFHEIANVCGRNGIDYILTCADSIPMDIYGLAPSCVPATNFETSGARITTEELREIKKNKNIIGLGELMNYPGVISGDPDVLSKIDLFNGMVIDGHAPGVSGKDLNAYVSAGIMSDHECTTLEEASEKMDRGMYIMIREGSSEKNLEALLPLVNENNFKRCFFVVDDRNCEDLLTDGDVDAVIRRAIIKGLDPVRAIQMATINTAEYFRLDDLGAIAPGYRANLIVLNDLKSVEVSMVYYDGNLIAENGNLLKPVTISSNIDLSHSINIKPFELKDLRLYARGSTVPVIEVVPDQIITKRRDEEVKIEDGLIIPDIKRDILKLAVLERHRATGNIGLGMVRGFGLKEGALASTIAHDSHNIIAVGTNDQDLFTAIKELERLQGGLTISAEGQILSSLALPVAGLLSEEPLKNVVQKMESLHRIATKLGCKLESPFATLSFLALPVIPELRLTDMGLVDVTGFELIT